MPDSTQVLWWNLSRNGEPLDPETLPPRDENGPPLKNWSPYTPDFLVDGDYPPAHLHHKNGRIIGIHGESDLVHLQLTLLLCLEHEELIIRELSRAHDFDIKLADVYGMLP